MEDKRKEIVGNVIRIQRYHSPCGDLMLGSFEDRLCLCDWAVENHRDIVDRRLRKVLKYRKLLSSWTNISMVNGLCLKCLCFL